MTAPGPTVSESARVTTAAESLYRIAAPNSRPRAIKVVALDRRSDPLVAGLATQGWANAAFLTASPSGQGSGVAENRAAHWRLRDIAGQDRDLPGQVADADLIVMVTTAGERAPAAAVIGGLCRVNGVMTMALVVADEDAGEESMALTLAQLRPYSMVLASTSTPDYLGDLLTALRA